MEKEEKIVVILLCMALFSLAIAYTFFCSGTPADDEATAFSSSSLTGDKVRLEGDVLTKRFTYSGDHLLMDVDYGSGVVKVFVPSGSGSKEVDSAVNVNDRVLVFGTVSEYEGELEVVVDSSSDVTVL